MTAVTVDSCLKQFKLAQALAAAAIVAWISMHLFMFCLGQGITAGDLKGRASPGDMAHLERAFDTSLFGACVAQLLMAWIISRALRAYLWRSWPILRFVAAFVAGIGFTAILLCLSLSTGGLFVVPSFEHWVKIGIKGS
jgi:hypothetical protein